MDDSTELTPLEKYLVSLSSPHTKRAYTRALKDFAEYLAVRQIPLTEIKPGDINHYRDELIAKMSPATVNQRLSALRQNLDDLVRSGVLTSNPAKSISGVRESNSTETPEITPLELCHLFSVIDLRTQRGRRDRLMFDIMLETYCRVGALLQIKAGDIVTIKNQVFVKLREKNQKLLLRPISKALSLRLSCYVLENEITDKTLNIFRSLKRQSANLSDRTLSQSDLHRIVRGYVKRSQINLRISPHSFRVSGITQFLRKGGRIQEAQKGAGHVSVRTTERYDRRLVY